MSDRDGDGMLAGLLVLGLVAGLACGAAVLMGGGGLLRAFAA